MRHAHNTMKKGQEHAVIDPNTIQLRDLSGAIVSEPTRALPNQNRRKSSSAMHGETTRPVNSNAAAPLGSDGADKHATIPLLCPYVARNTTCPYTEQPCPFLHQGSMEHASLDLYEQWRDYCHRKISYPKFDPRPIVCYHWRNQECRHGIDVCWYAHWEPTGGRVAPDDRKLKTCFFWSTSRCTQSAERCPFAHEQTGEIAPPPKKYQHEAPSTSVSR